MIIILLSILLLTGCSMKELTKALQMNTRDIDLNKIGDIEYSVSHSYRRFNDRAQTSIRNHKIVDISVNDPDTDHAILKERVIPEIIRRQIPAVDVVSVATTTSIKVMKNVDNSLSRKTCAESGPGRDRES